MEHITSAKLPQVWIEKYQVCDKISQKDPMQMSEEEIKKEIGDILFDEDYRKKLNATDRELLSIVILEEKAHFFNFLKGYTQWNSFGVWGKYREHNISIEIEFRDNPQECVGNRLMHLIWSYNKKVVGEEILYARTSPIEEGTLFP